MKMTDRLLLHLQLYPLGLAQRMRAYIYLHREVRSNISFSKHPVLSIFFGLSMLLTGTLKNCCAQALGTDSHVFVWSDTVQSRGPGLARH